MPKRILMYSLIVVAALATAAPSAAQDDDIVYNIIFYSDASHTTQVGFWHPGCGAVQGRLNGVSTNYQELTPAYRCDDGQISPL